jgi:hypothetical protein
MPTEKELNDTYRRMTTAALLEIIAKKSDYTYLAISVAETELKHRNVSTVEMAEQKPPEDPYKNLWMQNCLFDLTFWQKVGSYFFGTFNNLGGMALRRASFGIGGKYRRGALYSPEFKSGGYLLKSNQYNFYRISGLAFLITALIASQFTVLLFLCIWAGGFLISYAFDIGYNKQRQIDKLNDVIAQGELPWGY